MIVKFATTCDNCAARSDEYTAWPSCRECAEYTCPACRVVGSETEADVDEPETCLCKACARAEAECADDVSMDGCSAAKGE